VLGAGMQTHGTGGWWSEIGDHHYALFVSVGKGKAYSS
jgi:hypothetical protein